MLVYLIIFFIKIILLSFFLYKKYKSKRIKNINKILEDILVVSKASNVIIINVYVNPAKEVSFEIPFFAQREKDEKIKLKFKDINIDNVTADVLYSVKEKGVALVEVKEFPEGEIKQTLLDRKAKYFEMYFLRGKNNIFYMCSIESSANNRFKDANKRRAIDNGITILRHIF